MSDTDDTDDLLLIPPDFFQPEPHFDPYYKIVDSLLSQVDNLKSRVDFIETTSELGSSLTLTDSLDMYSHKRYDEMSSSTQNTPQKPRTKFTVRSLPNSPGVKSNNLAPMLHEIDSFISNVKQIKRLNAVRNLEHEFVAKSGPKSMELCEVDAMLRDMETQQEKIEEKLRAKEQVFTKESCKRLGENVNTVPDVGYGIRQQMYDSSRESESFDLTQIDAGLVSLGKLWNDNNGEESQTQMKFQQKLQEERIRRQHCETAIKELQNRILELQERISVAIEVDESKDRAIKKFQDVFARNESRLKKLEDEREKLEKEREQCEKQRQFYERERDTYERERGNVEELKTKVEKYETSWRHNQERMRELEKTVMDLQSDLRTAELNSEEFQQKYVQEMEKNKHFPGIIAQKELELNECKNLLNQARNEIFHTNHTVETCQKEVAEMKMENNELRNKLDRERELVKKFEEQKSKLLEEISVNRNISESLKSELSKTRDQLESNKVELKSFYQGQVELLVQNKLKEFQKQLDDAEKHLKEELAKKEMTVAKNAASHIQQIGEKHAIEIKLLEEKHTEQCRLYRLQLARIQSDLDTANQRTRKQQEKQSNIEKQLSKFMESLKQDRSTNNNSSSLDDLQSFRAKSFNNLEEILGLGTTKNNGGDENKGSDYGCVKDTSTTPVLSKSERGKRKETNLHDTIQMLLTEKKAPSDSGSKETKEEQAALLQRYCKDMKASSGKPAWK